MASYVQRKECLKIGRLFKLKQGVIVSMPSYMILFVDFSKLVMILVWFDLIVVFGLPVNSNIDLKITILFSWLMTVYIMGCSEYQIRSNQYATAFSYFHLYYKRDGHYWPMKELLWLAPRHRIQCLVVDMPLVFYSFIMLVSHLIQYRQDDYITMLIKKA